MYECKKIIFQINMGKACVILSCQSKEGPFFYFPNPKLYKDRFLMWLSLCGNPSLLKLPVKKIKLKSICKDHFEISYFIYKRLCTSAVPTLKLPRKQNIYD